MKIIPILVKITPFEKKIGQQYRVVEKGRHLTKEFVVSSFKVYVVKVAHIKTTLQQQQQNGLNSS